MFSHLIFFFNFFFFPEERKKSSAATLRPVCHAGVGEFGETSGAGGLGRNTAPALCSARAHPDLLFTPPCQSWQTRGLLPASLRSRPTAVAPEWQGKARLWPLWRREHRGAVTPPWPPHHGQGLPPPPPCSEPGGDTHIPKTPVGAAPKGGGRTKIPLTAALLGERGGAEKLRSGSGERKVKVAGGGCGERVGALCPRTQLAPPSPGGLVPRSRRGLASAKAVGRGIAGARAGAGANGGGILTGCQSKQKRGEVMSYLLPPPAPAPPPGPWPQRGGRAQPPAHRAPGRQGRASARHLGSRGGTSPTPGSFGWPRGPEVGASLPAMAPVPATPQRVPSASPSPSSGPSKQACRRRKRLLRGFCLPEEKTGLEFARREFEEKGEELY